MPDDGPLIQLLLARLERISADSPLAHRASGVRGALLHALDDTDDTAPGAQTRRMLAVDTALEILGRAAAELRAVRPIGRRLRPK